ncbi:MAG: DUF3857 domain-containing protein [Paraburkholderia sp.]|nr:MAG: DUF3857 domain-containing protein [Paraburkholderia sp.]
MTINLRSPLNRLIRRAALFAFWTALVTCPAWCYGAGYQVSEFHETIKVDEKGRTVIHVALAMLLSSDAAVQRFSQYAIPYNAELQSLEIVDAETIHTDGTHDTVDRHTAIFDRPEAVTVSAPQFSAMHVRVVAFPALSKGDTIRLSYAVRDIDTLFPGKFSVAQPFPPSVDYANASVDIDTPAEMAVVIAAPGLEMKRDAVSGKRRIQSYTYRSPGGGPLPEQANVLGWPDVASYFAASNFGDYADLAQEYEARAGSRAAASSDIQQLADQLTSGVADRREQAARLYDWVSRNIRYVGVYLGAGGVVPHAADEVLHNRYGDCKDHVALLEALLAAKHIASDPVLVNLGNEYRLPDAPVIAPFNHAIAWLPEFNLFADTTAGFAPFGTLAFEESDKPALDTTSGAILRTPPQNSTNSRSSVAYAVKIGTSGDAEILGHVELAGDIGVGARAYFSHSPISRIEYDLLNKNGLTGYLHVVPGTGPDLTDPFTFSVRGRLDQLAVVPGPAAIAVPQLPTFSKIQTFADMVLQQNRRPLDGTCRGTRLDERYVVSIPPEDHILATPTGIDVSSGEISYHSSYRREGNTVVVERILDRKLTSNVCSGAKLMGWVDVARAITKDLKRQVLYK